MNKRWVIYNKYVMHGKWNQLIAYSDKEKALSDFEALKKFGSCFAYKLNEISTLDEIYIEKNA